ncbi:MAG: hypothetical protein P8Z00_20145 [Anaerolineales bacterium]
MKLAILQKGFVLAGMIPGKYLTFSVAGTFAFLAFFLAFSARFGLTITLVIVGRGMAARG